MVYSILFIIACCITYGLQFHLGLRRRIPAVPLALAMTASVLLLIIFMKLPFIGYGLDDAQIASSRYMMTGTIGIVIALIISRYVLDVGLQRLDDASLIFPLSMGIVKVGCFFAGCCFGIPGAEYFGVTYEGDAPAFVYQEMHGTLVEDHTAYLHPVQLYEAFGCALILAAMWTVRKRWKQPGSSFFFLLVLYLPLRFTAEFFRASDLQVWNGLKQVQVISFMFWIVSLILLRRNEQKTFFKDLPALTTPSLLVAFFLGELVLFFSVSGYLHFIEKAVITLAMTGTLILLARDARTWRHLAAYRAFMLAAGTGIVLVCTAQVSKDSLIQKRDTVKYNSIHFGLSGGDYINTLRDSDGCGATTRDYNQKYFMVGAGFSTFKQSGKKSIELGGTVFGGKQSETAITATNTEERTSSVGGVHPYVKFDASWVGLGAGLNIGNLRYAENRLINPLLPSSVGYFTTPLMPSVHMRFGPRHIFFTQYDLANAFPSSSPGNLHQLSIGTGFGIRNGFNVRFGSPLSHSGAFLSLTVPTRHFAVDANYTWGKDYTQSGDQRIQQFRFSLRYHLKRD